MKRAEGNTGPSLIDSVAIKQPPPPPSPEIGVTPSCEIGVMPDEGVVKTDWAAAYMEK